MAQVKRYTSWVAVALLAVVVAAGAILWVVPDGAEPVPTLATTTVTADPSKSGDSKSESQDSIAARPMLNVGQDWNPSVEVEATTEPLELPLATTKVNGWIDAGYPATPEGAVAQLASLNRAAYRNFDVDGGREVYTTFAMDGAVPIEGWSPTQQVMEWYAEYPNKDRSAVTASWQPRQGLIKGTTDGGRWATVCVLGELTYSYNGESRTLGVPDCARMQWSAGQWRIAPGAEPSAPTVTWPRSENSYKAGYRDLTGGVPGGIS